MTIEVEVDNVYTKSTGYPPSDNYEFVEKLYRAMNPDDTTHGVLN
jgi:hypothetical protein